MKIFLLIIAIVAFVAPVWAAPHLSEQLYQREFTSFVKNFEKKYTHDEFFTRYNIFKANWNVIRSHNMKEGESYSLGMNEFGDMTLAEFSEKMLGYKNIDQSLLRSKNTPKKTLEVGAMASTLDWRQKGAVTPVKNQAQCGSCWAFSATGSMEGAHAIKTGKLLTLSEQQLVDCSTAQGNHGCNGGLMDYAFQYVISNKGITSEDQYPYKAKDMTCQKNVTAVATISKFVDVAQNSETGLMSAVNTVPVSVAIEADKHCFQFYSGGVLDDATCGKSLNHGVLAVGYGTDSASGKDFWIVKNSWGSSWGEQGYIRMVRGKNQCGISAMASYAVI